MYRSGMTSMNQSIIGVVLPAFLQRLLFDEQIYQPFVAVLVVTGEAAVLGSLTKGRLVEVYTSPSPESVDLPLCGGYLLGKISAGPSTKLCGRLLCRKYCLGRREAAHRRSCAAAFPSKGVLDGKDSSLLLAGKLLRELHTSGT